MTEAQQQLVTLAKEVGAAVAETLGKYIAVVVFIREHRLDPKQVTKALTAAGWAHPRIYEVKRLAFCSEVLFQAYKERLIGFRPALAAARAERATPEEKTAKTLNGFKAGVARLNAAGLNLAHVEVSGLLGIAFRPEALLDGQQHKIDTGGYSVTLHIAKHEKSRTDNPGPGRRASRRRRVAQL